ncbi:MAG: leucine-rich repeat domain-containing protein [Clostridiales bacterium]|jgi:hypothetical protein|nr:leucine-rich repeat domain-containing protein [Clostridiales bacterium]
MKKIISSILVLATVVFVSCATKKGKVIVTDIPAEYIGKDISLSIGTTRAMTHINNSVAEIVFSPTYSGISDISLGILGINGITPTAVFRSVTVQNGVAEVSWNDRIRNVNASTTNSATPQSAGNRAIPQNSEADFKVVVAKDGEGLVILDYIGSTSTVSIPATIQGLPVKEIGNNAFRRNNNITSVVIPEGVTIIQSGAGDSLSAGAFTGCTALTSITLPESLVTIGANAFSDCRALSSVVLPKKLNTIGPYAFFACGKLSSISIPNSVTWVAEGAFRDSGLTSITWPNNVGIPEFIFRNCSNLQSVVIPEGITIIRAEAFAYCNALTSITLPSTIREINGGAFKDCSSLTNITIPESVGRVSFSGEYPYGPSFKGCSKLTLYPSGFEKIGL